MVRPTVCPVDAHYFPRKSEPHLVYHDAFYLTTSTLTWHLEYNLSENHTLVFLPDLALSLCDQPTTGWRVSLVGGQVGLSSHGVKWPSKQGGDAYGIFSTRIGNGVETKNNMEVVFLSLM